MPLRLNSIRDTQAYLLKCNERNHKKLVFGVTEVNELFCGALQIHELLKTELGGSGTMRFVDLKRMQAVRKISWDVATTLLEKLKIDLELSDDQVSVKSRSSENA